MSKHLAITIDVEGDDLWSDESKISCTNISALRRFHTLARAYGYEPTYLVSYEVLQDRDALKVIEGIQQDGGCEVGAHLHPWLTPPYGQNDGRKKRYPFELEKSVLTAKLQCLTDEIQRKCGVRPRSYRAGAWGFGRVNAEVLTDLGYLVDCSITPYVSWETSRAFSAEGKDFRRHDPRPFRIKSKTGSLLEVPVSIYVLKERLMNVKVLSHAFYNFGRTNPINRLGRILGLRPIWLRPFNDNDLNRFMKIYDLSQIRSIDIIEMMFHSSELMVGANSTFRNHRDMERLFGTFEHFFSCMREEGVLPATLHDYAITNKDIELETIGADSI
jgi:hypothetical protein